MEYVIRYAFVLVLEGKLAYWDDAFRDVLVLVQEGKLTYASFPPQWNDVVRDAFFLVHVKEEKLGHASFPP
jgi:uncharacterized protein YjeT (DUF2065 family)